MEFGVIATTVFVIQRILEHTITLGIRAIVGALILTGDVIGIVRKVVPSSNLGHWQQDWRH